MCVVQRGVQEKYKASVESGALLHKIRNRKKKSTGKSVKAMRPMGWSPGKETKLSHIVHSRREKKGPKCCNRK